MVGARSGKRGATGFPTARKVDRELLACVGEMMNHFGDMAKTMRTTGDADTSRVTKDDVLDVVRTEVDRAVKNAFTAPDVMAQFSTMIKFAFQFTFC